MAAGAAEAVYERERTRSWKSISRRASDLFSSAQALQAPFGKIATEQTNAVVLVGPGLQPTHPLSAIVQLSACMVRA
jgi:hypothetical protein